MKKAFFVPVLALMLMLGLTSCTMGGNDAAPGTETNNSSVNGTGQTGDLNQDEIGNADANTNDNSETQARRSSMRRRTAYDYLNDGRYEAGKDGMIRNRDSIGKDLTQGARDLIRDAKDLGRDMARDAGDAVRDAGQAAKDTGKAVGDGLKDSVR